MSANELLIWAVVTIIASGGFATIVVRFMERRKLTAETGLTDAQATDVLVTAGEKAVGILEGQLDRALARLDHLEAQVLERDREILLLKREVSDLRVHVKRLESGA